MPDEIDLLRAFRADTPGPDDAAWERARAAVALAEPAATPDPGSRRPSPPRLGAVRLGAVRRRRIPWGRVILATAVACAGVFATVLQKPPTLNAPVTTAWQPARLLPAGSAGVTPPTATWHLTSYLVSRSWQENTSGPAPGPLTCPTAATCYVEGNTSTSPSGPADMNSFYVSSDGAQTWSVLPVPTGVTFTSALSCASGSDCAAGGLYYGHQPVYLTTANGGHSWTVRPLPATVGQIMTIACVTATGCRGLASASGQTLSPGFGTLFAGTRFFATRDGGKDFTVTSFPSAAAIQSVTCPTAARCLAVGVNSHFDPHAGPDLDHGWLLTSDDGGRTWQRGAWPAGYGPGWQPEVTCTGASHCAMIGFVEHDGTEGNQYVYSSGKDAVQYSVIGFSSDGGRTWRTSPFPRSIPYPLMNALTCPSTTTCYAAGSDNIAQQIGNTYNESSSVVAITHDGGRTWQRVTFTVPAQVPGGMQGDSFMDIGQIECPQADACVAMGISDQGSTSTPIYTNHN